MINQSIILVNNFFTIFSGFFSPISRLLPAADRSFFLSFHRYTNSPFFSAEFDFFSFEHGLSFHPEGCSLNTKSTIRMLLAPSKSVRLQTNANIRPLTDKNQHVSKVHFTIVTKIILRALSNYQLNQGCD